MSDLDKITDAIRSSRRSGTAKLVAVSGIDHAGKSHWAHRIAQALRGVDRNVARVSSNDWFRAAGEAPPTALSYYHDALRLDDLFAQVLFPLRARGVLDAEVDLIARGGRRPHRHRYQFADVDVVLVDGPFLLKRAYQRFFDFAIWIDATPETALERALAARERRTDAAAIEDRYRSVYLPAHDIHLELDDPQSATMLTIRNDDRLPVALKRVLAGGR